MLVFNRLYVDVIFALFLRELNNTIDESEQSVVLTHANVYTGAVNCAALTFDNVTCFCKLTTKNLDAQSFAF